jgi:hypothetical protein
MTMASKRDDFKPKTMGIMAKRVGYRCSNPNCRKLTCGANDNPENYSNIGVAAHICAAAPGGKRYDSNMTPTERKDIHNGIWLCQSCSKLSDSDDLRYTVDLLHQWKRLSEEATVLELATLSPAQNTEQDKALIKFYVPCFDRPAFRDDICQEGRMEDFDRAIEDTIIALNTGVLRTRAGETIKQAEGKAFIQNPEWREKLYNVVDILTAIRRRLKIAEHDDAYIYRSNNGYEGIYYFNDRELEEWFNFSREEILKIMSSICREIGMPELRFPRHHYYW